MSTKISKKKFTELVRNLLQKEIEEASTTTSAGIDGTGTGHYDTPKAFSTGSGHPTDGEVGGYKKINEADDHEGKMAKAQLERSMEYAGMIYKMIGNVDTDGDGEVNFPSWVQSYLTKSQDYLQSVYNYLDGKDGLDDKFQKNESVNEDAKDVAKAKKLSQKLQSVESRYRKVMYDLSDRLQADPKNHKLQDELIKSYTKHVTTFMKDMIKITKRVK